MHSVCVSFWSAASVFGPDWCLQFAAMGKVNRLSPFPYYAICTNYRYQMAVRAIHALPASVADSRHMNRCRERWKLQ